MSAPKPGDTPNIHQSTKESRDATYERLRDTGIPHDAARSISEQATRQAHDQLNRRGR